MASAQSTVVTEYLTPAYVQSKVAEALAEDLGAPPRDPTTESIVPEGMAAEAILLAKSGGVMAGLLVATEVFRQLDARVEVERIAEEGALAIAGDSVARLRGPLRALLSGERVALNFLQRLSGIATMTRRYVDAVAGTGAVILDTRKTTPGLRPLERYAVAVGGGVNHRYNLASAVLIKDNHVLAAGGVAAAVRCGREAGLTLELEVDSLEQLDQALELGVELILLDNFSPAEVAEAARRTGGRAVLEVSGGVLLNNVRDYALTGVDRISIGALTHSAPALDISMDVVRTWKT